LAKKAIEDEKQLSRNKTQKTAPDGNNEDEEMPEVGKANIDEIKAKLGKGVSEKTSKSKSSSSEKIEDADELKR
jgi:hypothetical protein